MNYDLPSYSTVINNELISKIAQLDPDTMYDYTYQVDPDVKMDNPLDPQSYLNPYHPFNKFTICQFDLANSNFKVLNKR